MHLMSCTNFFAIPALFCTFLSCANKPQVQTAQIQSISPNLASTQGGTTATLQGIGFPEDIMVTFNGKPVELLKRISENELKVLIPQMPGTQGNVSIQLLNPSRPEEQSEPFLNMFSYYPANINFQNPLRIFGIDRDARVLLLDPSQTEEPTLVILTPTPNFQSTDLRIGKIDMKTESLQLSIPFSSPSDKISTLEAIDVTGDQKPDLLLGTEDGKILIYPNDGNMQFLDYQSVIAKDHQEIQKIIPGDFNQDGTTDIAFLTKNAIGILFNDGKGFFSASPTLLLDENLTTAIAVDFDHDQSMELLVATNSQILLFQNDHEKGFQPPKSFGPILNTHALLATNQFSDGKTTVMALFNDDPSSIAFYHKEDDLWNPRNSINLSTQSTDFVFYDMNGDGFLDILGTAENSVVSILLGQTHDSFEKARLFSGATLSRVIGIADLNHDHKPDLIMLSHSPRGGGLSVLLNSSQ